MSGEEKKIKVRITVEGGVIQDIKTPDNVEVEVGGQRIDRQW